MIKKICKICKKEYETRKKESERCSRECYNYEKYSTTLPDSDIQVLLSAYFGDGCFFKLGQYYRAKYSSKYREYILFKQSNLLTLPYGSSIMNMNCGYKHAQIFSFDTYQHPTIDHIYNSSVENNLNRLTELGIAMWFYDDGSLHNKKHFYNLNTHSFDKQTNKNIFIPYFKDIWGISPTLAYDRKSDGRIFTYLRINKLDGADKINNILKKYPLKCFSYKRY